MLEPLIGPTTTQAKKPSRVPRRDVQQKTMKTVGEIAAFIRHRQHELAPLAPVERQAKLVAELRQFWRGTRRATREELLDRLEPLFPVNSGEQQSTISLGAATPAPAKQGVEELVDRLAREIEIQLPEEQAAIRERVAKRLGCQAVKVESAL